jgi:hypothetical protein
MATEKNDAMEFEEIERAVNKEIEAAIEYRNAKAPKREKNWDRLNGVKLGNEVKGRSQFITRDLLETIESIMPFMLKLFASGDSKVEITIAGQETWVNKALMQKIQLDLGNGTPNIFTLFYQWFKDALVSDTAFIKSSWELEYETVKIDFDTIHAEQMQQLVADPDIKIKGDPKVEIDPLTMDILFHGVAADVKRTVKDGIYAECTPHWEFLVEKKARSMNDEHGKGQETEVTVDYLKRINRTHSKDGDPFFKNLDKIESGESKASSSINDLDGNYVNNSSSDDIGDSLSDTDKGVKAPVKFVEWYTRLDVDGDGYLEDIIAYSGNGHLLRWEKNDDRIIPFSSLSPIINCYQFFGTAYADLLVEIQNLKTMLLRRILDNFDFQNSGRWLKDPNSGIDSYQLLHNSPGTVVTGKIDGLKDISPAPFNASSLSILEYIDTIKENRTSITRYNQGGDANSLNKTARGIQLIQSASMQRLELIARTFAELGIKDFYRKCALLYQKHLRIPFKTKVFGQEREVTPELLQGHITTTVNMGVIASVGAEEADKLERVLGVLFKVNEAYPGLLTPESAYNLMARYISASGFNNVDDFIGDVKEYVTNIQKQQEEHSQMQQQMMQIQQRMQEMELQFEGQNVQIKGQKVQQDGAIAGAKLAQEKEIAMAEIAQKDMDSKRDYELGLLTSLTGRQVTNNAR